MGKVKPVHFTKSYYNGQDYDTFTVCGLGDFYEHSYKYGTSDINKVTCKNCLRILGTTVNQEETKAKDKRRTL